MENRQAKSSAGRKIRWLAFFTALAIVIYSVAWYWMAGQIDAVAGRTLEQQKAAGIDIVCADRSVGGYPFRFEVHCSSTSLAQPAESINATAGAFRSAAQVYQPNKIVAELDGPVALEVAGLPPINLQWDLAHASALVANPLPERASIEIEQLRADVGSNSEAVAAAHYEGHMRRVEGDLDLAARFEGVALGPQLVGGRELPPLGGDYDLRVNDGVRLIEENVQSLRGVSGELRNAILRVTLDQGVEAAGTFAVGDDGLVNADIQLTVVDPAGLAAALKPAFPEYASQIDMLVAMQPASGGEDGPPEIKLPVTIRDGEAKMGFIPLGTVPAVQ